MAKMLTVTLRSVLDGSRSTFEDDGYANGNEEKPGSARRRIIRLLDKTFDGKPIWYAEEPLGPSGQFEPIKRVPVWGPAQDEQLEANMEARKLRRLDAQARVAAQAPTTTSLGVELKKKAEREAAEAESHSAADAPKPKPAKKDGKADAPKGEGPAAA